MYALVNKNSQGSLLVKEKGRKFRVKFDESNVDEVMQKASEAEIQNFIKSKLIKKLKENVRTKSSKQTS